MRLIVDANILFAAMIKDGMTSGMILHNKLELFAPEFLFEELLKYEKTISEKTHRIDYGLVLDVFKRHMVVIPFSRIQPFMGRALRNCDDSGDSVYVALALCLQVPIWSNDKGLKKNKLVNVLSTEEVMCALGI